MKISGFADEISPNFDVQLETVKALGMRYISLRAADGKGIADYTLQEIKESIAPRLAEAGIGVSSLGSPIGKIDVDDEAGFVKQLTQLETLCQMCSVLQCRYIRIFSFYIPQGQDASLYRQTVIEKLRQFIQIAEQYHVILIHENEKGIYGDTAARCCDIMEALAGLHFRFAFDFANFVQCGEDPQECWNMLQEYIEYIHIKDAVSESKENVLCGTGEGKIKELLERAICKEGYDGFLTLEPHLVLFDSLSSLETGEAAQIIRKNKAKNGAEAYQMQYRALQSILEDIGVEAE